MTIIDHKDFIYHFLESILDSDSIYVANSFAELNTEKKVNDYNSANKRNWKEVFYEYFYEKKMEKSGGVYYTNPKLVEFLIERIDSVSDVFSGFRHLSISDYFGNLNEDSITEIGDNNYNKRELLSFKILDPACGSGGFLCGVARKIYDKVCEEAHNKARNKDRNQTRNKGRNEARNEARNKTRNNKSDKIIIKNASLEKIQKIVLSALLNGVNSNKNNKKDGKSAEEISLFLLLKLKILQHHINGWDIDSHALELASLYLSFWVCEEIINYFRLILKTNRDDVSKNVDTNDVDALSDGTNDVNALSDGTSDVNDHNNNTNANKTKKRGEKKSPDQKMQVLVELINEIGNWIKSNVSLKRTDFYKEILRVISSSSSHQFKLIIGNPPFNGKIPDKIIPLLRAENIKINSNPASLFFLFCFQFLPNSDFIGFILPKASAYSSAWQGFREKTIKELFYVADLSKAFGNVKLEELFYFIKRRKRSSDKHLLDNIKEKTETAENISYFSEIIVKNGCNNRNYEAINMFNIKIPIQAHLSPISNKKEQKTRFSRPILIGLNRSELDFLTNLEKAYPMLLKDVIISKRGYNLQKLSKKWEINGENNGSSAQNDIVAIGGKEIRSYGLSLIPRTITPDVFGFNNQISKKVANVPRSLLKDCAHTLTGKGNNKYIILGQLANAHVTRPKPHFKLAFVPIAANNGVEKSNSIPQLLKNRGYIVFDTVIKISLRNELINNTLGLSKFNEFENILYLTAYLNSRIAAWYLYKIVYSGAIRSTRLDSIYLYQLPFPFDPKAASSFNFKIITLFARYLLLSGQIKLLFKEQAITEIKTIKERALKKDILEIIEFHHVIKEIVDIIFLIPILNVKKNGKIYDLELNISKTPEISEHLMKIEIEIKEFDEFLNENTLKPKHLNKKNIHTALEEIFNINHIKLIKKMGSDIISTLNQPLISKFINEIKGTKEYGTISINSDFKR